MLGAEGWDDVPISLAVSASAALPMVYKPLEVKGRELIDGGIVSTTNLDIAVEAGAKFIVVVNPLVPYVNDFSKEIPTLLGSKVRRVSDMGFPKIAYQTFKLLAYQRLHEMARQWEERYPGVDIVLIEPEPDDELMFQTNIMNYSSRLDVARHGFQSVTVRAGLRLRAPARGRRAPRDRDLRHARAQGGQPLRRREARSRAPGAGSSSRPRARCCGSPPARTTPPPLDPRRGPAFRARRVVAGHQPLAGRARAQ